jgi:hypothetical protein
MIGTRPALDSDDDDDEFLNDKEEESSSFYLLPDLAKLRFPFFLNDDFFE